MPRRVQRMAGVRVRSERPVGLVSAGKGIEKHVALLRLLIAWLVHARCFDFLATPPRRDAAEDLI